MLALLSAGQRVAGSLYLGRPADWGSILANSLADWWTCGVYTPAIYWVVRRYPIRARNWWKSAPIHLVASVGFVFAKVAIYAPVFRWLNPDINRTLLEFFTFGFSADMMGYWA